MAVGDPTGEDLCVGTTNGNTLPGGYPDSPEEREITFGSSVELTSGVKYAIVVRAPDADFSNYASWAMKHLADFLDAHTSSNSGSTWSVRDNYAQWFRTKATGVVKDGHTFTYTGDGSILFGSVWEAQTFVAGSTYTITSIVLLLRKATDSTPGTITVSIKATETLSPPEKPINPTPADGDTDVNFTNKTLSWEDGGGADTFDVSIGDTTDDLTKVSSAQAGTSYVLTDSDMDNYWDAGEFFYWRIDATNDAGTTTGDEWNCVTKKGALKDPRIWFSEVDDFDDFEAGVKDADSFSLTIPATNEIRWIESLEALLVGTSGGEWRVGSNDLGTPITPTNFTVKQQSNYGSRNIQPAKVNEQILFVDFVGRKTRELTYSDAVQKYVAPDLTALAEHITSSGIVCIAHQRNPDSILWAVLDDGSLISMTYEREQNVVAWSKHPIDGEVLSVAVTPSADEDEIHLSIIRDETVTYGGETVTYESATVTYGVVYIEKMMPRIFGTDLTDAFFVDSGITVTNTPASTTIAGLTHLVGKTVTVLGDGTFYTPTAVVDDDGEVEISTAVEKAQVGLAYTYKLEPMRPDVAGAGGTSHGSIVKVPEMGISFLNTMNAKYGVDDDTLYAVDWTNARWTNNTEITGLFTGDVVVVVDGGFTLENNLIISGSDPLPATVRALIPKLEVSGR